MKFLKILLGFSGSTGDLPAPGVRFINKIDMNIDMTKAEFF